jgi:hypothetical protein
MANRHYLVLICAIVFLAIGSWLSLTKEKQVADARVACGEYVSKRIGPSINLEASSQWPATPRSEDTWIVQANYSLRGRYDAMWCHLRVLGSQFGLARLDSDVEDSRRAP